MVVAKGDERAYTQLRSASRATQMIGNHNKVPAVDHADTLLQKKAVHTIDKSGERIEAELFEEGIPLRTNHSRVLVGGESKYPAFSKESLLQLGQGNKTAHRRGNSRNQQSMIPAR